jgi:hypothetical protein
MSMCIRMESDRYRFVLSFSIDCYTSIRYASPDHPVADHNTLVRCWHMSSSLSLDYPDDSSQRYLGAL